MSNEEKIREVSTQARLSEIDSQLENLDSGPYPGSLENAQTRTSLLKERAALLGEDFPGKNEHPGAERTILTDK